MLAIQPVVNANQLTYVLIKFAQLENNVKMEIVSQSIYAHIFNAHSENNASKVTVFQSTHAH
jgi:hypothetical protein